MYSRRIWDEELVDAISRVKYPNMGWRHPYDVYMLGLTNMLAAPYYTCLRPPGAAGAILVINGRPSWGAFLGCAEPPVGPTCKELGECEIEDGHCVRTIHAEVNAILLAAQLGIDTEGATIYSLLKPCYQCSKVIVAAGIHKIVYAGAAYDEPRTRQLLEWAAIETVYIDIGLTYGQPISAT